jgi:hypothetical protein
MLLCELTHSTQWAVWRGFLVNVMAFHHLTQAHVINFNVTVITCKHYDGDDPEALLEKSR